MLMLHYTMAAEHILLDVEVIVTLTKYELRRIKGHKLSFALLPCPAVLYSQLMGQQQL